MPNYTKTWSAPLRRGIINQSGVSLAASICLMPDNSIGQVGGLPAAIVPSGTPKEFLGVCPYIVENGRIGDVACTQGDVIPILPDHTTAAIAIGDRLTISVTGARAGHVQKTTTPNVVLVGTALEASISDSQPIYVRLDPKAAET